MTQDIGTVGLSGTAGFTNSVFTLVGAGGDIQGTADAFRFVYVTVTGACTITARVDSVQNIDPWSKAGIMIRASLDAGAANAFVAVTPGNGVTWQYRSSAGGGTSYNSTSGPSAPYWVKLVRSGNTFTGYRSPDGVTWTQQGTTTNIMSFTVYVGLALTSHNTSSLGTATFDNVTVPGWPASTPPAMPTNLVATAGDAQVALSWSASSNATSYFVKRSAVNGSGYVNIATNASVAFTNTGLANGTLYYFVVSAWNSAGESTNSAQVSARPTSLAPVAINVTNVSGQLRLCLAGGPHGLAVAIADESVSAQTGSTSPVRHRRIRWRCRWTRRTARCSSGWCGRNHWPDAPAPARLVTASRLVAPTCRAKAQRRRESDEGGSEDGSVWATSNLLQFRFEPLSQC